MHNGCPYPHPFLVLNSGATMNRQEFLSNAKLAQQKDIQISLSTLLVAFTAVIFLITYFQKTSKHHPIHGWHLAMALIIAFTPLFASIAFGILSTRNIAQKFGLLCPCCNKSLYSKPRTMQFIAETGVCIFCHGTLFSGGEPEVPPSPAKGLC
jgi:cytochrome c553